MTTRTTKAIQPDAAAEADAGHQDGVDGFIARHRDALNASIQRSREEMARGVGSTRSINDIVADGRKLHRSG